MPRLPGLFAALLVPASLPAQAGAWTVVASSGQPALTAVIASFGGLVHDPVRQRTVLFGHVDPPALQTWELDGTGWSLRSSVPFYPYTNWSNLVYDELRSRVLMVTTAFNAANVVAWNGQNWQMVASTGPAGGRNMAMARDPVRDQVILLADSPPGTWVWDGANWSTAASVPPAGSMAFDPVRGEILCATISSTWSWDGTAWHDLGIPSPGRVGLVTDPLLGRVLGMDGTGALWDWHGAGWDREVVIGASHLGLLAFDGTRGGVLCCLPESGGGTWLFRELPVTSATFSASGQGCAGPLGTPLLAPVAGAVPRLGRVFSLHMAAVPDSPLNLAFGVMGSGNVTWSGGALPYDLTAIGAPGCLMQVDPQVAVPLPIQNQGAAWDIQIPAAQVLAGTGFFVQGAVVVPGWNAAGLVVSNAGQGVVGSR